MFTTEKTIHIALEILVIIALYFFLSSRAAHDKQVLEARIEQLEERLEFLEALIGGAARTMPQQPQTAFVFHAPPAHQSRVGDEQVLEELEPESIEEARELSPKRGAVGTELEVAAPIEEQAEKEDEIVWDENLLELEEE